MLKNMETENTRKLIQGVLVYRDLDYRDWKKGAISSIFLKIIFSENAKEVDEEEQESVSSTAFEVPYGVRFEKRHAEHGPPVFFEFGKKYKRIEKLAELFQELQNKYWEPICDRFTAWPLILGKDYIVEMTDVFEMDSVVFEGKRFA